MAAVLAYRNTAPYHIKRVLLESIVERNKMEQPMYVM